MNKVALKLSLKIMDSSMDFILIIHILRDGSEYCIKKIALIPKRLYNDVNY